VERFRNQDATRNHGKEAVVMRTVSAMLSVALLCALLATVAAQEQVTVQALLNEGKKYDGKQVVLVGIVRDIKEKVSKKGNPYYTFKIGEGKQTVSVFGYGKATVKNGDKVRVTGKFAVEKRVAYATYRNEIDVTKGKVEVLTPAPTEKEKTTSADKK
jgi:cytochrome c-type biogenesis protein CcmE